MRCLSHVVGALALAALVPACVSDDARPSDPPLDLGQIEQAVAADPVPTVCTEPAIASVADPIRRDRLSEHCLVWRGILRSIVDEYDALDPTGAGADPALVQTYRDRLTQAYLGMQLDLAITVFGADPMTALGEVGGGSSSGSGSGSGSGGTSLPGGGL